MASSKVYVNFEGDESAGLPAYTAKVRLSDGTAATVELLLKAFADKFCQRSGSTATVQAEALRLHVPDRPKKELTTDAALRKHLKTSNDVDVKRAAPTKQAPPPPPAVHSKSKAKPTTKTKKQQVQGDPDPRLAAAVASFVKNGVDAFKARQLRVARDAWEAAVALYPACVDALIGLAKVDMSIDAYAAASKHLGAAAKFRPRNADVLVMLGEAQLKNGDHRGALQTFDSALRHLQGGTAEKGRVTAAVVMTWSARVLTAMGDEGSALRILTQIIQSDDSQVDAMLQYAQACVRRGVLDDALNLALKSVVLDQDNRQVRALLTDIISTDGGVELLKAAIPNGAGSAAAYAFIATICKDFGALPQCIELYRVSLGATPTSHSYALNFVHALECAGRYQEAFTELVAHLTRNPDAKLPLATRKGNVTAAQVVALLEPVAKDVHVFARAAGVPVNESDAAAAAGSASSGGKDVDSIAAACGTLSFDCEWDPTTPPGAIVKSTDGDSSAAAAAGEATKSKKKQALPKLSDADLDLLALYFTAAKILFVSETVRRGHLLHTTTVRNEHAYYCCIAQLLPQLQAAMGKALRVPAASTGARSASASASTASAGGGAGGGAGAGVPVGAAASVTGDPIYVFGDSHTLATAWRTITVGDAGDGGSSQGRLLVPRLATGVKAWHLRPESQFYPKHNFEAVLASIPDGSDVVMLFCEIDCREGLLLAVERCKYPSLTKAIEVVVGIYMDVLRRLRDKHKLRLHVHPIVPVLKETRPVVKAFNAVLRAAVIAEAGMQFLDFFDAMLTVDAKSKAEVLKPEYELDGTHLHPQYLELLQAKFE